MSDNRWLVCPFCGLSRKLIKSGIEAKKSLKVIKGLPKFDVVDPTSGVFIDYRDITGGRGSGFPRIDFETLEQIKNNPEYEDLILQLRSHCDKILSTLK